MSHQLQVRFRPVHNERRVAALPLNPAPRSTPIRLDARTRPASTELFYFSSLEADSHLPEVQIVIREAIRRGTIRVQPIPGCENRVRISQAGPSAVE